MTTTTIDNLPLTTPTIPAPARLCPDSNLLTIISAIESSGSAKAVRFEPQVFDTYQRMQAKPAFLATIARLHEADSDTAMAIASTSWGKYQLMGENLYQLGYADTVFAFADSDTAQLFYMGEFLTQRGLNVTWASLAGDSHALERFGTLYNGSSAYGDRMLLMAKKLRLA